MQQANSNSSYDYAVLGGGAWGTAIAVMLAQKGTPVLHWMRDEETVRSLKETGENSRYLPGVLLSSYIQPTSCDEDLQKVKNLFVVVPTQSLRNALNRIKGILAENVTLILCSKGIEQDTGLFPSEIAAQVFPQNQCAVLSGPSFADDVVRGLPTAVTLVCPDGNKAQILAEDISGGSFRIYHGTDVRGVEIGGAAKNVYAIGCGALIGRGLGESAKAALIARSFAELLRFAEKFGGRVETLMGLSGLGDLLLTCSSPQSRNFSLGLNIGKGLPFFDSKAQKLAEGAFTASILAELADQNGVDLPVVREICALLGGRSDLEHSIARLLSRPVRKE